MPSSSVLKTNSQAMFKKPHATKRVSRFIAIFTFVAMLALMLLSVSSASSLYSGHNNRTGSMSAPGKDNHVSSSTATKPFNSSSGGTSSVFATLMPQAPPGDYMVQTFAADCVTPKSAFNFGDTLCAVVSGGPPLSIAPRRLALIDSGPFVRETKTISADPESITFLLPATPVTIVDGETYDNRGTWKVNIVPAGRYSIRASASFTLSNPVAPVADLAIYKSSDSNSTITAGSNLSYGVYVTNQGPDTATGVTITDAVPANTTFLSGAQDSGPGFNCTYPSAGSSTGSVSCSGGTLAPGDKAIFTLVFNVNSGTPPDTVISNTASVSSTTAERENVDNTATCSVSVIAGAAGATCTLDCPANITTNATTTVNGQRGAYVNYADPTTSGECGSVSSTPASGSFFTVEGSPHTVTATSETGGGSCSFTITVVEPAAGAPTITCPANQIANADSNCQATVDAGQPTTTGDNVMVTSARSDDQSLSDPYQLGTTSILWTATNAEGTASCTQTITVRDQTPPTITAPPGQSASADENCQAAVPDFTNAATTTDNCADVAVTQEPEVGTLVGPGTHTITLTAHDAGGNTATTTTTFTVSDTTAPTITCPADITQGNDPGMCSANIDPGTATATDNCSSATVTGSRSDGQALNAAYPVGTTTITWTATDPGSSASCTQTITVTDTENPTISCPANITQGNDPGTCSANIDPGTATATDNCSATVNGSRSDGQALNASYPKGTTTITWTATDPSGNSASCTQTITVNDTEDPAISCPADVSITTPTGECSTTVNLGVPTATDNCDGALTPVPSRSDNRPITDPFPVGTVTVTWTATDSSGNTSSCEQDVIVVDDKNPTITCPADITTSTDPGQCSAIVVPGVATATDNCGVATVSGSRSDGRPLTDPYPTGTTTITWTATDVSGNQASCTQTVTVNDTEAPAITCPGNIATGTDPGSCSATVNPGTATATDNCGTATVTGTRSDGQPLNAAYPKGTTTITWTATDGSGNQASCTQTVTVTDNQAPTITTNGQTPSMWPANHKYKTFQITDFVTGAGDNCNSLGVSNVVIAQVTSDETENGNGDGNTFNDIVIAADCKSVQLRAERDSGGNGRVYTITFRVTDSSGNVGTNTSKVVVPTNPSSAPVDSGPNYMVTGTCP